MSQPKDLPFNASAYIYPIGMVLAIWVVFWLEQRFGFRLREFGIQPRTFKGLRGILFSPFLHGNLKHILSNSLPLLVLSVALFYFYRGIAFKVLIYGGILTGLLTWIIGREGSNHIGASGIVYLMASFLFFKGIWSKNMRLIAVSLIVVFLYGSLVWGVFPGKPQISWEGHLSGFLSGIAMALLYKKYQLEIFEYSKPEPKPISAREAEFLRHFDENGNFVPASEWRRRAEEAKQNNTADVDIDYLFIASDKNTEGEENPPQTPKDGN